MDQYITIAGFRSYYGLKPFAIGNIICCIKDHENQYDRDAIKATLPMLGVVGYLANDIETVAGGTLNASRIYDKIAEQFYVKVCFTTYSKVICVILDDSIQARRTIREQMLKYL